MAEGGTWLGSWLRSFRNAFSWLKASETSGDAGESFCDPCKSDGERIYAEGYCQPCDEYLCGTCIEVHRKQEITKAHVILDKEHMPRGQGSVGNQNIYVDVCKTHHPKIIRFYCKAHDEPGCGYCMTLKHTTCTTNMIQDVSDGFQETEEFIDIDQQLQQIYQEIHEMEDELNNNLKNLDTSYNNILHKVESARKQINKYLDQIQTQITDEAAQMKTKDEKELKTIQAENQTMKAEIEGMLKTLYDSDANVNSLFVTTKQAKRSLVTMEKKVNEINQSQQEQQLQYKLIISNEIKHIVSAKIPLGKLSRKALPQKIRTKTQDESTPKTHTLDTTATYNRSINVKCRTDNKDCLLRACTLLSPDRMVVTDENNQNVKLIDTSSNTVLSTYSTSSGPWGVDALSTNTIAVALPRGSKIQILDITLPISVQREINVQDACFGVAYKDEKFAVSFMDPAARVDILDIHGKVLHTIEPPDELLQLPYHIIFGHDKDTVIVSDSHTNEVSVITFSGELFPTYTHDKLGHPKGIVLTSDGVMFVCNWGGRRIHVVSQDFLTSKIIIHDDGHVGHPGSLTYCAVNQTLYICNSVVYGRLYNQIHVYDLNV